MVQTSLPAAQRDARMDNRFYKPTSLARQRAKASRSAQRLAPPPRKHSLPLKRPLPLPARLRATPMAAAVAVLVSGQAVAQVEALTPALRMSLSLAPPARGEVTVQLPVVVRAQQLSGRPDLETVAEGDVELRRGDMLIRSDHLSYDQGRDLALARGNVRIYRNGSSYRGPELRLSLDKFEGQFKQPEYQFARTGAGGRAQRIDFLDASRSVAYQATYTSCPRDGTGDPAWLLTTDKVEMDFEHNEGIATGAVLRFMGTPILALPTLSFPLTDERKSGWLPPNVNLDNRSGLDLSVPFYWNIAPNRDATITPRIVTRRGAGVDTEFRYLEPRYEGRVGLSLLPNDQEAKRSRYSLQWTQESSLDARTQFSASVERVSDNDWWKDFPRAQLAFTPRLLPSKLQVERSFGNADLGVNVYARLHQWQVLQSTDAPVVSPYERTPQLGARGSGNLGAGLDYAVETEFNHFSLPAQSGSIGQPTGWRWHALGSLSRPWRDSGWWVVPKVAFNAASYATDQAMANGNRSASRAIPTFSLDTGLELERSTSLWGRGYRQTLEPRLLYVNTAYHAQDALPNFDAAGKDFNLASIYSENAFSGVDRVSDAHQITAGISTRLLDDSSGAEALRLSVVQRYLLRDQRVTPEGDTFTQRFSDVLFFASGHPNSAVALDAAVQYSPDLGRSVRSILGARYSPGPFKTINASYRLARGLTEQADIGWQWPVYGNAKPSAGSSCGGQWYSVGRINYSLRDSRITDSLVGFEYDAGCWIGRVVAERLSTGRSEATTRLLLQLELVGLSRLGSNPLKVLKDNIPGYQLLREERNNGAAAATYD